MSLMEDLIDQYRQTHAAKIYGQTSEYQIGYIQRSLDDHPGVKTILDYGCGQSRGVDWLAKRNDATAYRYDPAIPEYAMLPADRADLVISTDVLEHIPEPHLEDVLSQMRAISPYAFINVSVVPALEILPNGDNAHCTVRAPEWWEDRLRRHYNMVMRIRGYSSLTSATFVTWEHHA